MARKAREDQVARLREALVIARDLGYVDAQLQQSGLESGPMTADRILALPLYLRGTKALEIEIKTLEARKDDTAFLPGIRELERRIGLLTQSLTIDRDQIHAVEMAMPARRPYRIESPRYALILAIATLLALILGGMHVFLREIRSRLQSKG